MGAYRYFRDGYARESSLTYGTTAIPNNATVTYQWGVLSDKSVWPSPSTTVTYQGVPVSSLEVPAGGLWKNVFSLTGMAGIGLQNGILLQAAMGKSATVGAGPFTHTVTVPTAVAGVLPLLPSFTLQHEKGGSATAWSTQFLGTKVAKLTLQCSQDHPVLKGMVNWIAQKAVDPGFQSDNDPILPPTANDTSFFLYNNMTRTYNGATIDGFEGMELSMTANLMAEFAHQWTGGVYSGYWLKSLIESSRREYQLKFQYSPGSDDIWDDLILQGNLGDFQFVWTRGASDTLTANLTDCQITGHELVTPKIPESLSEEVTCEPRSVSFTVVDSIAGSYYGE